MMRSSRSMWVTVEDEIGSRAEKLEFGRRVQNRYTLLCEQLEHTKQTVKANAS